MAHRVLAQEFCRKKLVISLLCPNRTKSTYFTINVFPTPLGPSMRIFDFSIVLAVASSDSAACNRDSGVSSSMGGFTFTVGTCPGYSATGVHISSFSNDRFLRTYSRLDEFRTSSFYRPSPIVPSFPRTVAVAPVFFDSGCKQQHLRPS